MKRSEATLKIKELLENKFLTLSEVRRSDCEKSAEQILDLLEELGMKPPGHGNSGLTAGDFYIPQYTWEQE